MSANTLKSIRKARREASPLSRSEQTRRSITEAARCFLWGHRFRDMTVGALMACADISRPAFYQYFADVHELMESLLVELRQQFEKETTLWFLEEVDPVPALARTIWGVVGISYEWGPLMRAVVDSASTDERLEKAWNELVTTFDDAVTVRIEADQVKGQVPVFDARNTAIALNRMNVETFVHHFGTPERSEPEIVWRSIARVWICTIYGHRAWARVENFEFE